MCESPLAAVFVRSWGGKKEEGGSKGGLWVWAFGLRKKEEREKKRKGGREGPRALPSPWHQPSPPHAPPERTMQRECLDLPHHREGFQP